MSNVPPPPPPPGDQPPPPPPPIPGAAHGAGDVQTAGFGSRLVALIVDSLVLGVPFGIVWVITLSGVPTELYVCQNGNAICERPTGAGFGILALVGLAYLAVVIWYWGTFEGVRGQTIGKRAVGIKTVRIGTDSPLGFGAAIGRLFSRIISGFICYLGYLWMLWDDDSQTWHDKIVSSQVVRA